MVGTIRYSHYAKKMKKQTGSSFAILILRTNYFQAYNQKNTKFLCELHLSIRPEGSPLNIIEKSVCELQTVSKLRERL